MITIITFISTMIVAITTQHATSLSKIYGKNRITYNQIRMCLGKVPGWCRRQPWQHQMQLFLCPPPKQVSQTRQPSHSPSVNSNDDDDDDDDDDSMIIVLQGEVKNNENHLKCYVSWASNRRIRNFSQKVRKTIRIRTHRVVYSICLGDDWQAAGK